MTQGIPRDSDGYLDPEQVDKLIDAATNPRDKAFVALLARTGIRVSEVIRLKVSDIDFQIGVLTIVHLKEKSKLKCPNFGAVIVSDASIFMLNGD